MRLVFAMAACLMLAQCASARDDPFRVGESPTSYVIMGVAESAANTLPEYRVLWRRLTGDGAFMRYGARRIFEARTNQGDSVRVPGVPGEFILSEIEPGTYALDSVFAWMQDGRVSYIANGLIEGPERPSFTVRPGEAVYLGIWEVDIEESARAVTRRWRSERGDLDAALREAGAVIGDVRMIELDTVSLPCRPFRLNTVSQRRVCATDGQ